MSTEITPLLVAHRGFCNGKYPENSMSAFRAALEAGAPYIELDIQMTKDHQFVVLHNSTFMSTASVEGEVTETNFSDCMKISVHQPDLYGDKFYPDNMPSLQDVMDLLEEFPEAKALVEIKSHSLKVFGQQIYFEKLLPFLNEYGDNIVVISFSKEAIDFVNDNTECRTAWIFKRWNNATYEEALDLMPDILMCNNKIIPKDEALWEEFEFMIYGVKDADDVLHYGYQGVRYIEVDDVERFYNHEQILQGATSHRLEKEQDEFQKFIHNIPESLYDEDLTCNSQQFAQIVGSKLKTVTGWIRNERMPATPQGRGFRIDLDEALRWCVEHKKFSLGGAGEAVSLSQEKLKQQLHNLRLKGEKDKLAVQSAQLRLLTERGRYVDIELVQDQIDSAMKEIVASFRSLGQQTALKLATMTDRNKIQHVIDARVEEILDELKNNLKSGDRKRSS